MRSRKSNDRVTIKAVAAQAGVSAMTVSNVVNRTGKASAATRARVLKVIDELGYVPSQAARRLVGSDSARIGLIYPEGESGFVNAAIVGASVTAARRGLQLLLRGVEWRAPGAALQGASGLVRSGADALVLISPFAEALSGSPGLVSLSVPAVAVATAQPLPDMDTVRIDNHAAAYQITSLLIARGHRRIGVIAGPPTHSDSVARLEGHKAALRDHGIVPDAALCAGGDFTFASGLAAAETLLRTAERPTAIVAANDDMAAAALWSARRLGLHPPGDLAVTGFDDTLVATRVWPALTTVRQPIEAMIDKAFEMLLDRLRSDFSSEVMRDVVFEAALVERDSVARNIA